MKNETNRIDLDTIIFRNLDGKVDIRQLNKLTYTLDPRAAFLHDWYSKFDFITSDKNELVVEDLDLIPDEAFIMNSSESGRIFGANGVYNADSGTQIFTADSINNSFQLTGQSGHALELDWVTEFHSDSSMTVTLKEPNGELVLRTMYVIKENTLEITVETLCGVSEKYNIYGVLKTTNFDDLIKLTTKQNTMVFDLTSLSELSFSKDKLSEYIMSWVKQNPVVTADRNVTFSSLTVIPDSDGYAYDDDGLLITVHDSVLTAGGGVVNHTLGTDVLEFTAGDEVIKYDVVDRAVTNKFVRLVRDHFGRVKHTTSVTIFSGSMLITTMCPGQPSEVIKLTPAF